MTDLEVLSIFLHFITMSIDNADIRPIWNDVRNAIETIHDKHEDVLTRTLDWQIDTTRTQITLTIELDNGGSKNTNLLLRLPSN